MAKHVNFKIIGWQELTLFAISLLGFCVSLGTATVSIAKALVLLAFLVQISMDRSSLSFEIKRMNYTFLWMPLACAWMLSSMVWSEASLPEQWKYFYAHTRFLWLGVIFYLIKTKERGLIVLKWLIFGQILVVFLSWTMWLGFEIPLTRRPAKLGIAFTSYLEQPVMTTLAMIALWHLRSYWSMIWSKWFVNLIIVAMGLNIIFVMSGRSGYLVFVSFLAIQIYNFLPSKYKWITLLSPPLLIAIFSTISPIFSERIIQIPANIHGFYNHNITTSEGGRLEMWSVIIDGIKKHPLLGSGIGSLPDVYRTNGGADIHSLSQPHQQYLFWWSEFGLIGLLIMQAFFYALYKDSLHIVTEAKAAIISVITVFLVMGLFNSPFFGVGMGEFFFLEIAALLAIRDGASKSGAPATSSS